MGTESYDMDATYNGKPTAVLAIRQVTGANALDTVKGIRAKVDEMSRYFPHGMKAVYPVDTTPFTQAAIREVVKTLIEAIVLVFLIMWLFMGNIRATLIPTIAVPVVLLGTFAVLSAFGYSINMLTMFAMVLAIGLLVDDAIVVVENVERVMSEEGLSPREATAKSMEQITSALVGIALVLSAVFGPMAFFSGSTGIIYRQFSVTIIASMLLSVTVALILTPVLCATFLKPVEKGEPVRAGRWSPLRTFLNWFNRIFEKIRDFYLRVVQHSLRRKLFYVIGYGLILCLVVFLYYRMPTGFLPEEDQGSAIASVTLPAGSTQEQTRAVVDQVAKYIQENEGSCVEAAMAIVGSGMGGQAQNQGMLYIRMKDWDQRKGAALSAQALTNRIMMRFMGLRNARVLAFPPPAVIELGTATGFDSELVNFGSLSHSDLMSARDQLIALSNKDSRVVRVRHNGLDDVAQFRVDVDWDKAGALGVLISDIHDAISTAFGGAYVNNFVKGGRAKRVFAQSDAQYRMLPEDLNRIYVKSSSGEMVPFSAFASTRWSYGSPRLERFNGFPALNITGEAASGQSSGQAMQAMEDLVKKLPKGLRLDWNALSYQERMSTNQGPMLYAFSILVIFLCVAALYESWTIPFVNLLMLPLGVFGALLATTLRDMPNNVYFQIGFLTTLGLSTKNAILIIQFIKQQLAQGKELTEATLAAVRIRLRPVIMTSLAFFFGTLPLALANGAGAGAMKAIGTAVTGGMISATFIDLIFIPLFFVVVTQWFAKKKKTPELPASSSASASTPEAI
jgi:HAE1 family hydrophobic/amphiphilic exporter-1